MEPDRVQRQKAEWRSAAKLLSMCCGPLSSDIAPRLLTSHHPRHRRGAAGCTVKTTGDVLLRDPQRKHLGLLQRQKTCARAWNAYKTPLPTPADSRPSATARAARAPRPRLTNWSAAPATPFRLEHSSSYLSLDPERARENTYARNHSCRTSTKKPNSAKCAAPSNCRLPDQDHDEESGRI